jgi:hypothetical protein
MIEERDFRKLSDNERRVLEKLLREEFPGCSSLRDQLMSIAARSADENGSAWLRSAEGAEPAATAKRIPVEADYDDEDGVTVHVLLHVLNGFMDELEIFREDSGPLLEPVDADKLRVLVY